MNENKINYFIRNYEKFFVFSSPICNYCDERVMVYQNKPDCKNIYDECIEHFSNCAKTCNKRAKFIISRTLIKRTGCPSCKCILEHLKTMMNLETARNNYKIIKMLDKLHEDEKFIQCLGLCKPNLYNK